MLIDQSQRIAFDRRAFALARRVFATAPKVEVSGVQTFVAAYLRDFPYDRLVTRAQTNFTPADMVYDVFRFVVLDDTLLGIVSYHSHSQLLRYFVIFVYI